ncbi:MAG TPA: winged helix DNA-binding domain-containing protein [Gemmatimonadaceae bacterium]|nr:winged helix DNA-binding domain-containing protein [Gemmatimonadaceae bacterium]
MQPREVARRRIANQFLLVTPHATPVEVVAALGAVQAQDYHGAKWGVAQRTTGATDADLERAVAGGVIIRTHVLRPTWHFVAPADLRWMLELTGPRIANGMPARHRELEIDAAVRRRASRALATALRDGRHHTRAEIAAVFQRAGIDLRDRQRLAHLLMLAELDALVCSGPLRGKQFTWALLDERVPSAPSLPRDEAVAELVRRYFTTRGPATPHDFAWWSGLTTADAKRGLEMLGAAMERVVVDDRAHWFAADSDPPGGRALRAHLLPSYDELFVGLRDRSALTQAAERAGVADDALPLGGPAITLDGQAVGTWRRTLRGSTALVELAPIVKLADRARRAIAAQVERYGAFLGVSARLA